MNKFEVSIRISGDQENIAKKLMLKGFKVLWKVKTTDRYYIKNNNIAVDTNDLKNNCIRLRKVESLINNEINYYFNNKHILTDLELNMLGNLEVLEEDDINSLEKKLEEMKFKNLLVTTKIDFVLKRDEYVFQIQNIEGFGLIVSYDNEKYNKFSYKNQRKKLIEDLEKFEFQIIDYNDFDKFKELLNQRV
jgi:adenylate cyclase class IV